MKWCWLLLVVTLVTPSHAQNVARQVCTLNGMTNEIGANNDIKLGALFEMRNKGSGGLGCGSVNIANMQVYEAVKYAINVYNLANSGNPYMTNIKFGFKAYDTCYSTTQAISAMESLFPQLTSSSPFCQQNTPLLVGLVGPLSSSTAKSVAEFGGQYGVSIISPAARDPALSNKNKYPTFVRTVPSYSVFAKAVAELLYQLQWQNVAVIYTNDDDGSSGYQQLLQAIYNRGLCITNALAVDGSMDKTTYRAALNSFKLNTFKVAIVVANSAVTQVILDEANNVMTSPNNVQWILSDLDVTNDQRSLPQARGSLVVVPKFPKISGFVDQFVNYLVTPNINVDNPWFTEWYSIVYKCSPTSGTSNCPSLNANTLKSNFIQSPWVVPAIKAVFAYVEAVRAVCLNSGSVCQNLRSMTPAAFSAVLRNLDVTLPNDFPITELRGQRIKFDANGDPEISEYSVYNYNSASGTFIFEEIGTFVSDVLTLSRQPTLYDSLKAFVLPNNPTVLCPAHGCPNCLLPQRDVVFSYKQAEVVIATLAQAHGSGRTPFTCGSGIVPRLTALVAAEWAVGSYKLDNLGKLNGVSLGSLVADICPDSYVAKGFLTDLLSGNNRLVDLSGTIITPETIYAFVGLTESGVTKTVSPILSNYKIPEIEVVGTTTAVANGATTPYFTRAVPNDEVYYRAVSALLQSLGWKYVQVATYSTGLYDEMTQIFIKTAASYGICVVNTAVHFDTGDYNGMLMDLNGRSESQVVVVIGGVEDVRGLLGAINATGNPGQLQLVAGSDRWALNPNFVQGLESAAANTIVVDLQMPANVKFNTYLSGLTRSAIVANPFLRELFEITNRCSLDVSTRGLYTRTCTSADTNVNFYQGRTPYVIQSIYTVADKLHEIIQELCNTTTYTGLCSNFHSAPDIGQRLDAKLQNVGLLPNGYGIKDGEGVTDYIFYVYRQGNYTKFAQFNTDSKQLSSIDTTQLANYQSKKSQCSGACFQCGYMFNIQNSLFIPGDWLIAGAFSVSNPGPANLQPYACGSTRLADGPQYTMAMLYALNRVNSGQASVSVPGVTFGGLALDHCTNPGRAKLMASAIYSGFMRNGVDQSKILAWITDDTASTNETAEILNPLEVAMVSPSATSARLLDFPNFYRTIQGDRTAALALVKIIKAFGFPYIQVVYGDDDYGIGGLEVMTTVSQSEGICITYSHKLSPSNPASSIVSTILTKGTDVVVLFLGSSDVEDFLSAVASTDNVRRKLLILLPEPNTKIVKRYSPSITRPIIGLRLQRSNIVNYNNYINSLPVENPYFARYYMALKNCNLPGYSNYANPCPTPLTPVTNDTNYIEDNYILATINSVYAVVNALHLTVAEYCNQGYKSPCPQFYAAQDRMKRFNLHLKDVTFTDEGLRSFMFLDKEGNTVFEVLQTSSNGDYKQIGSYAGITLDLLDSSMYSYTNVTSSCIDNSCLVCVTAGFNFSHIPGDVYLAGIFDVHQRSLSPFTCGPINPLHGYLLLEAFNFAINQVNSKQGQFASILPNTRLGGIGLDACNSQVLGGFVVSNINSGYTTLLKDGMLISPSKIDAYIGSYTSKASIYLARILTDLKIPQISYAAGSQDLNDKRVYPFFYRTVPSDGDQVEAMLKFLDKMDIRYIQILHEDNSNGISAKDYLITRAAAYRICVAQTVPFPDLGVISPETSNGIVAKLLQKPAANTVVTFLSVEFVNSLLLAIGRSSTAQNKLRFVGSSSWADSQDAYRNAETWAVDSVTLKLDSNDVYDFETYMNSKTLANSDQNPWFEEYYQYLMNCYTSRTHTMGYPRACSLAATTILNSPLYQQDPGVVYVINAVYAAAFALDATLKQKCGLQYTAVCQAYRNSADRRVALRNNLANVTFNDPSGNEFVFVNRSGVAGYKLNSVFKGVLGVSYNTIGSYNITTNTINISPTYTSQWDSNCDRREACAECPEIRDNDLRYVFSKDSSITTNATTIVGFFDIHKQGADPYRDSSITTNATTIVGFFDIHKQGADPYRCGELNMPGFHHFLAFFYGAQKVVSSKVKGKVRILAIDTCSNSMRVDQDLFGLLEGTGLCNTVFDNDRKISLDNLGSVITMGDLNTMAAARVLEQPRVTYLSPNALSSYLDDYDYLLRTVAPNKALVRTLAALFTKLGWGYLDVVYQLNSPYGAYYYKDFNNYAKRNGLCEGSILGLDSGFTTADIKLNGNKGSKAVVLFGSLDFISNVLSSSSGFIDQYTWILGGDWTLTTDDFKRIVPKGKTATLITLKRQFYNVKSFLTYLTDTLKYNEVHGTNTASIPTQWFDEFYQTVFNCTISTSTKPINIGKSECLKNQTYSTSSHDKFALNTIAAVFAAASGLEGVQTSYNTVGRRNSILQNTLSVSDNLVSPSASLGDLNLANPPAALKFEFDKENHWWNSGLEMKILSVSVAPDDTVTVKEIKTFNVSSSFSDSQIKDIQSAFNVSSICTDSSGCRCSSDSTSGKSGAQTGIFSASDHRNYYLYNDQDVLLYDWPVWAIVVAILTSLGLLITVILFLILVIAYPVRKGTTVLGYMVIVGILGIYVINFAFFVNANEATCGSRRFLMGVVYMIAFAPLLIKALDNWRFSQVDEKEASKDRYTGISSACSLFFASLGIVLVQCIIPIIWLILVHPTASYWGMADAKHDNWWCDPPEDYDVGIVLSMVFVMFIVLMTGIFSAITYDSERNNYESRWILFGSIATAGCFVVWMIVSTNAGPPYRDAAVSIGNLVNATLLMLVMPFRKSVLLCQSKRGKKEAEYDEDGEPNSFSNGAYNPGYELSDYDQYNTKPSEF